MSTSRSSPQPPGGVDFLVRTMIEREATGKRPIRPKNVEDLLQSSIQDESDDPDFDCEEEDSDSVGTAGSSEESKDSEYEGCDKLQESDEESDDEDYLGKDDAANTNSSGANDSGSDDNDGSSNNGSQGSESDEPETAKKSTLRETWKKLNEADEFIAKRSAKRKRKAKSRENTKPKKIVKKVNTDSRMKSGTTKKLAKSKIILTKKSKNSKRKLIEKKKRRREKKSDNKLKHRSILSLIDNEQLTQKENRKELTVTKPICSACLGEKSDDSNEIVECDACGISVHEICYGLSADNLSISSGSGSSSCTEPWFCDVCKSGSENIYCELCPIEGGLFKESTAGRWVHLVCAMYTQGVALHHDSSINLFEIHYARWGSHVCAACDNERQAHSGIVISCDAGLCKTYFHATCAQKLGLLSDPNQVDFAEADPYYVSCKLHTNRETMKRRIRLFNALQEQLRIKMERKESEVLPSDRNNDHARILRKLDKVRKKTALRRAQYLNSLDNVPRQSIEQMGVSPFSNLPSSWTNGNKKQRLMHTSSKLGKDFLRKIERLGEDIVTQELEVKHERIVCNVKRKWNVLPAMSVEYAAYYADRETRIRGLVEQYHNSVDENNILMDKEIGLKDVWETHMVNQMAMTEETDDVSKKLESLASILTSVCPADKRIALKLQSILKPKELIGFRRKSSSMSKGDRKSPTPRRSSTSKKSIKHGLLSPSPSRAGKLTVAVCDTCSKSDGQHLITRCDKCRKHYHLSCLDPPLTRMPKRSRLCGWMCSDCCEAPSETEGHVDTEAPRTLRGRTKIHKPRKYRGSDESDGDGRTDFHKSGSKKSPRSAGGNFNSPEPKPVGDLVTTNDLGIDRVHSSTPIERRRRSDGVTPHLATPIPTLSFPIVPPVVNEIDSNIDFSKFGGVRSTTQSQTFIGAEIKDGSLARKLKGSKKAKISTTPKLKKPKKNACNSEQPATNINNVIKKKFTDDDSLLATLKVNGVQGNPVINCEDFKSVVSIPNRKPQKKKKTKSNNALVDQVKQELCTPERYAASAQQKKLRKKKEPISESKVNLSGELTISSTPMDLAATTLAVTIPKLKKSRKKEANISTLVAPENTNLSPTPEKRRNKKSIKPRISLPPVGVDLEIRKFGSQIVVDKALKNLRNGAVKVPQKRKNTTTLVAAGSQPTVTPPGIPDEIEKSVPPKKRKRVSVSSQAQSHGQPNSVDSIIKAVSSGNFSDGALQNADLKPTELSALVQVVSPVNRQIPPEHNIMQGKAMGSGISSGEMITVDASFLIDGTPSTQSSFSVNTSRTTTFYSAPNHQNSASLPQDDSTGVMTLGPRDSTESGNSENVIRLQYIDTQLLTDGIAIPPPAPLSSSSNVFPSGTSVCANCTKTDSKNHLVMCDKCQLEYHFMCLNPPVKFSPRRKGHPWFCRDCDDGDSQAHILT